MAFKCWKCGACCRFVGLIARDLDRGDRACIHLQEDMSCAIYDLRPDFCRLDPERPESEQEKWCKLQEANWPKYLEALERVDRNPEV